MLDARIRFAQLEYIYLVPSQLLDENMIKKIIRKKIIEAKLALL